MAKNGLKEWIKNHPFGFGAICLSLVFLIWFFWPVSDTFLYSNYESNDEISEEVILEFYDVGNNCSLNGEVYVEGEFIGKAINGELYLSKDSYVEKFSDGVELKMKGLTDSCFGRDSNLPFVEYWTVSGSEESFFSDEVLQFETELNPRWPVYLEAVQGFIRPYEVENVFLGINFDEEDSYLEDLEKILATTYLTYFSDKGQFGETEYWQTPGEFARSRQGDCEDWAVYSLSLLRNYDLNLDCYLAWGYIHISILCNINETFVMFDQYGIEESFSLNEDSSFQTNQIKTRKWKDRYFENYGFTPEERVIWFLINDKEIIEFEDGKTDFTDWVVNKGLESFNQ